MCKILVIEDDESLLMFMDKLLTLKGFIVLTADCGKIGLDIADKSLPDLIICDILMPDLNGYEVIKKIRNNPKTEAIPFIFLTGKSSAENLRQGMNLGADDYLIKPFTKEDLFTAIDTRLKKKNIFEKHSQETLNILRHNLTTAFPHEFRTPLQNIILATDYLEILTNSQAIETADLKEIIEIFRESSQRLLTLSQKFLFYSNLEYQILENKNELKFITNSKINCLENIIKSVAQKQAKIYQRTDDLKLEIEEATLLIKEDFFVSLLTEIIDNSLKFSVVETPIIISGYLHNDKFYQINITNQGRGFSPNQLKNVGAYIQFERQKYEQQGSGLGLAIAQKIVEIYQGDFQINSIPNEKTTIMIKLPIFSGNRE